MTTILVLLATGWACVWVVTKLADADDRKTDRMRG
jgi:hypothetical protein